MRGEKFKIWPTNLLPNTTLITIGIHVTNLGYLENISLYFKKLSNSNLEESNKILIKLDIATIIIETNNQDLPDLIDLKPKQTNKKKKKVVRC